MVFKDEGVGSKRWYLQEIKSNSDSYGISFLTENAGIYHTVAREAVQDLTLAGYVRNETPDGKRPRLRITSYGNRYLEEHKDGDPEPVKHNTTLQVGQGARHPVIDLPKPRQMFKEKAEVEASAVFAPEAAARGSRPKVITPPAPSIEKEPMDNSFEVQFRLLLGELMIPRFAKEVTAQDILEHLDNKKG